LELGSEEKEEGSTWSSFPLKNRSSDGDSERLGSLRSLLEGDRVNLNSLSPSDSSMLISSSSSSSSSRVSLPFGFSLASSSGTVNSKSKKGPSSLLSLSSSLSVAFSFSTAVRIVVVEAAREEGVSEEGGSPRAPPPLQYLSKVKASMVGRASIPKWAHRETEREG